MMNMHKRDICIVANWKMNQTLEEIKSFFIEFSKMKMDLKCKAMIAPQFIHIPLLKDLSFTTGSFLVGAQNASHLEKGAFTGDISPLALSDMGCDFVILGHSERRAFFQESDELINQKILLALKHHLKVIFCVGETLEEREAGKTNDVILSQLTKGLHGVDLSLGQVMIAYEPVWAIGTGKTATTAEASDVHAFIRSHLGEFAEKISILYGGSVRPDNIDSLLNEKNIDGALVGGASLKASDYIQLCLAGSRFQY